MGRIIKPSPYKVYLGIQFEQTVTKNLNCINPEEEEFEILKVHDSTVFDTVSLCYGSVRYQSDLFWGLYVIHPDNTIWIYKWRSESKGGRDHEDAKIRLKLMAQFASEGFFPSKKTKDHDSSHLIPIEIAVDGKPAIAAHLFAVELMPLEEIRELLEVSEVDTVRTYLYRYDQTSIEFLDAI